MNEWRLLKIKYLSERSKESDKSGQIPKEAKYRKFFLNEYTGELTSNTDLESKKRKRTNEFNTLYNKYNKLYQQKKISILSFVVYDEFYSNISSFISMISKKLKRKQIFKYDHIWCRDIGDENFEKHFHVIIWIDYIDKHKMYELFHKKHKNNYKVQLSYSQNGLRNYLTKKELYGIGKQRSFGKSKIKVK